MDAKNGYFVEIEQDIKGITNDTHKKNDKCRRKKVKRICFEFICSVCRRGVEKICPQTISNRLKIDENVKNFTYTRNARLSNKLVLIKRTVVKFVVSTLHIIRFIHF